EIRKRLMEIANRKNRPYKDGFFLFPDRPAEVIKSRPRGKNHA
ncbi:hypothetical protein BB65665_17167, partial [Bacillus sp. 916]